MTRVFYWCAPLYTAFIVVMSLIDNAAPTVNIDNADKIYHATAYVIMTLVWYVFFYSRFLSKQTHIQVDLKMILGNWSRVIAIGAAVISFLIGGLIELGQEYISVNRTMDLMDVLANTSGIIIAVFFLMLTDHLFNTHKSS